MVDDQRIDAALRDVPVPGQLADRVASQALFADDAIDRLLCRVPLPDGLADRLRAGVFATAASARRIDLDRSSVLPGSAAVAAPGSGSGRLARSVTSLVRPAAAVAVSLAGLAVVWSIGAEFSRRMGPAPPRPVLVLAPHAVEPAVIAAEATVGMATDEADAAVVDPVAPLATAPPVVVAEVEDLVVAPPDEPQPATPIVRGAAVGPAATTSRAAGMRVVPIPGTESRRSVPREAGFDLAFEMAHGESPFVDPAAAPLRVDHPPLTMRSDALEHLRWALRSRQRSVLTAGLRAEELLAALPAPPRSSASGPQVAMQAVRSLRSRPESCLVEICVTAPPLPRTDRGPLDAVLAIDRYAGSDPLLWSRICRAVAAVAAQMRDDDRVAVVVGGRRPQAAGDRLDAAGLRRLAAELMAEPADDVADFDATMRAAVIAAGGVDSRPLIVIANVESVDRARGEGRTAVASWREGLASAGPDGGRQAAVRFVLIDPAERGDREPLEPEFGRTRSDTVEVARAVLGMVFAAPTLAVRQCRLEVAFDPRSVAAYRLVGHRQSAAESLAGGRPAPIDLHAGETTRVVYEVVPEHGQRPAVTATLFCRPVGGNVERTIVATLPPQAMDSSVLPSPHGCELLLAAGLGELAAGSPHAGQRGAAWQALASLATSWRARGDLTAHGALLVDAVERLGPGKVAKPAQGSRR